MSELTLKPCPFCGGALTGDDIYFGECEAETYEGILSKVRRERFIGGAAVYFVHCPHCDAHLGGLHKGDFGSPEEAADNWNTRAYEANARLIAEAPLMYDLLNKAFFALPKDHALKYDIDACLCHVEGTPVPGEEE